MKISRDNHSFIEIGVNFIMENIRRNQKIRQLGNSDGSLYYSDTLACWMFQYYGTNGKRQTIKQMKKKSTKDFKARVTKIKNSLNNGRYISKSTETDESYHVIWSNHTKTYNKLTGIDEEQRFCL